MRLWASWTATTAMLAAGLAAAAGGLSGAAPASGSAGSGHGSVLSAYRLIAPVSSAASVCGDAAAVLGDSTAGCVAGALAGATAGVRPGVTAGRTLEPAACGAAGSVIRRAAAPVRSAPGATGPLAGLQLVSGLAPQSAVPGGGLADMAALNGLSGGGLLMPETAVSTSGMSSDSFAALAVGTMLAGASALKIAGRRARDRKTVARVTARRGSERRHEEGRLRPGR